MSKICLKYMFFIIPFVCLCCRSEIPKNVWSADAVVMDIQNDSVTTITIPAEESILNIDDVLSEMKYIKLETNAKSLIGRIDKLILNEGQIFIKDMVGNQIISFNESGKYLFTINNQGNGPNEYNRIHDFALNKDSIIVYDNLSQQFVFYNRSGKVLGQQQTYFNFKEFRPVGDGIYIYALRNNDNKMTPIIDGYSLAIGTLDSITYRGFLNNSLLSEWDKTINNSLIEVDNEVYFSPLLSNSIYAVDSHGKLLEKYALKYHNQLPSDYFDKTTAKDFDKYIKRNNYHYYMGQIAENTDFMFLRILGDKEVSFALVDKKDRASIFFSEYYGKMDKYLGYNHPNTTYGEYFVSTLDPSTILDNNNKAKIEEKVGSVASSDNPIIILYKFQKL